jgi:hypothetical protein
MADRLVAPHPVPPGRRRPHPPGRTRPHPPATFIAAGFLAISTGLLIVSLLLTITAPLGAVRPPPFDEAPVRSFYAGLNAILAGRGATALLAVTDPALVVRQPDAPDAGRAALVAMLARVRPVLPELELSPKTILGDDTWILVHVHLRAGSPQLDGRPLGGSPVDREIVDRLQVVDGRIRAYWPGDDLGSWPQALPPVLVAATPGVTASAVRLQLEPGARTAELVASGPHLLLGERGAVEIRLAGTGQRLEARTGTPWQPLAGAGPGPGVRLGSGDVVVLDPGARITLANLDPEPASVLGMATLVPAGADPVIPASPAQGRSGSIIQRRPVTTTGALVALYHPGWLGQSVQWQRGVRGTVLAAGEVDPQAVPGAACRWELRIIRLRLEMGQQLPDHPATGLELVVVQSGRLLAGNHVQAPRPGAPTAIERPGGTTVPGALVGMDQLRGTGVLAPAGQALTGWAETNRSEALRNDGERPLALVRITLSPPEVTPC